MNAPHTTAPVAAIDCGTNSIRLLIAHRPAPDAPMEDLVREMEIVRLGYGVDRTGRFDPAAVERTLAAASRYRDLIAEHGATDLRFVATSATRDAENRQVFLDGIREILGVEVEVISGQEEAELSFTGAVSTLPSLPAGPHLVVDIGGGSTELVLGDDAPTHRISMDIGSVRLTERHLHDDPATSEQIQAAIADIDAHLDRAHAEVPWEQARTLVGVAGTVTTLSAIALDLPGYQPDATHGAHFPTARTLEVADRIIRASRTERKAAFPALHPGRVDVIGAGALIWSRIVQRVTADAALDGSWTSEHDILDGIALSVLQRRAATDS